MLIIFDINGKRKTDFGTNNRYPMGVPYQPKEGEYAYRIHDTDPKVVQILDGGTVNGVMGELPEGGYGVVDIEVTPYVKPLEAYKQEKVAELSAACNAAIVAGFYSSTLGVEHHYPFDMEAQANIQGAVGAISIGDTSDVPFKTLDAGYLTHTVEQFKVVGLDAKAHLLTQLMKNQQLKAQVEAATSEEEVNNITW